MKMLLFFSSWFVFAILSVGILVRPAYGFNNDEYADIVWHNKGTGENLAWFMNQTNYVSSGSFTNDMGVDWHIVATADFDRDSHCDLLWRNETTGANTVWFMSATNRVSQTGIQEGDPNWYVVGVYDLDGDGWNDIVWRHMTDDKTAVWYMNYTNFITSKRIPYPAGPTWRASAVADCNNDGFGDIIWRETSGAGRVSIWFMQNTNRLNEVMVDEAVPDQTFQLIAAGPLNRLGNTDFLWQKDNFMNYVWLMASNHYYYSTRLPDTGPNWEIGGIGGYRDYLHQMLLTATVNPSAASILLNWRYGEERPVIQRKTPSSLTWTTLVTNSLPRRFTNTADVAVGQRYEYKVGTRYLLSAINDPPIHERGKLILVVDKTVTNAVEADLALLRTNLVGDGWTVIRTNVPRHDEVTWSANTNVIASIKSFVLNQYLADPANTKAVLLFGHVPIPYSGFNASDGHPDHVGAWTADGYYGNTNATVANGDMLTQWTDNKIDFQNPSYPEDSNRVGDGKWDNDFFPFDSAGRRMQIAVGRVDFAKLTAFFNPTNGAKPISETGLLSRYVQKNHKYRNKQFTLPRRLVASGWFGVRFIDLFAYHNAMEAGRRWFGADPGLIVNGDFFLEPNPFFAGVHFGWGKYFGLKGAWSDHDAVQLTLPQNEPKGALYMLSGSYLSDFNMATNSIYRAILATANYGLAAVAMSTIAPSPWRFEPTGLDEPLGSGIVRTINEAGANSSRWMGMMGDPTLRVHILAPPSNLTGNNGTDVNLSWSASPASEGAVQYFVYRSTNNLGGPWQRLTDAIAAANWRDHPAPSGAKMYRVRAAKLTTTGSGSFTNLSQGIFLNVN